MYDFNNVDVLKVFLTLSADDLKEIGLDKFGPRRKMTNAIESWHKENAMLSDSGADTSSLSGHVEKLQIELQEKHRQLTQVGYHRSTYLLTKIVHMRIQLLYVNMLTLP